MTLVWTPRASALDTATSLGAARGAYAHALGLMFATGYGDSGATGFVRSSDGGATWVDGGNPLGGNQLFDIAWSSPLGLLALVGSGTSDAIATSPDGSSWTPQGDPFGFVQGNCVIWEDATAQFVAGGNGANAIASSPDGSTWTPHSSPLDGGTCWGVARSPSGTWVAVGLDSGGFAVVCSGPNLDSLTLRSTPFDGSFNCYDVIWSSGASKFFAVGSSSDFSVCLISSAGGTTWAAVGDLISGAQLTGILEAAGALFASGVNGSGPVETIERSDDNGVTWALVASPFDNFSCVSLFYANELETLVALGQTSTDSIASAPLAPTPASSIQYQRIYGIPIDISDNGVETVNQLLTSPDGFTP